MASISPDDRAPSTLTMSRRCARKCERYCCLGITYFPLLFVYGITSWAIWVVVTIGFEPSKSRWIGTGTSSLAILLYLLLNWSYTTAVFTDPGSTTVNNGDYESLPTRAPPVATSFTVKSTGELRFCKKCQARKPDRAHHCSSCKRCVLKMDHHCPWLATCVGLRNYKAFLLFLTYTTLFCLTCFAVTGSWIWTEILSDGQYTETLMPINYVMLAVISGIIGLVQIGFTGWHFVLASRNQTTIECLEKTRYLSPLRQAMRHQHFAQHQADEAPSYSQQLKDIHTNALPGVTRPEEGEIITSKNPEDRQPRHSFETRERLRARERYEEYLDEQDSEKLPHAFDLGWRRNLATLFGDNPLLWVVPISTTSGDGWSWEASAKWISARDHVREERIAQQQRENSAGWGQAEPDVHVSQASSQAGAGRHYMSSFPDRAQAARSATKVDRVLGRDAAQYTDDPLSRSRSADSRQELKTGQEDPDVDNYDSSSDEMAARARKTDRQTGVNWNSHRMTSASGILGRSPRETVLPQAWPSNYDDEVD